MVSEAAIKSRPPEVAEKSLRIGDLLLQRGLISQEQIDQALRYQKEGRHAKLLGEIFVELKFVSDEQVMRELATAYGVPFARVTPRVVDPRVMELLPRDFVEKQLVLPLFLVNGKLTVALHEPTNVFVVEEVERITGQAVQVVAATLGDIRSTLENRLQPNDSAFVIDDVVEELEDEALTMVDHRVAEVADLQSAASESPVIKLVNFMIYSAVRDGASDIHIEPDDGSLRVRYRIDGRLVEKLTPPHAMGPAIVSRIKIMGGMDISERRVPQDGGITVMADRRPVDLRVSTMPGKFGEKVVLRVIDNRKAALTLEKLAFSPPMLASIRQTIARPNGIMLVTGPTGSGKSTTLYAVLNELRSDDVNISTVEDPVEFNLAGVNQFQTNERAGFNFANALRALLRQDPDIIMVGEIRDQDTAKIATQAALTGHMVLSTLHTNDAPSAITRLINMGVEPFLVAATVRGMQAQRLIRRICTACKEPMQATPQIIHTLEKLNPGAAPVETLYHGVGCSKCHNTGYAGRLGIFEWFVPDDESLDAITRGASLQELRRCACASGSYTTLAMDGLEKLRAGLTSVEELLGAVAVD